MKYTLSIALGKKGTYSIGFNHDLETLYYKLPDGEIQHTYLGSQKAETKAKELLLQYIRQQKILVT